MYKQILVPVDLTHVDRLGKALQTAADLSRHYGAPVCYVGVTSEAPSPVAHNPKEFAEKLDAFGKQQASDHGITATTRAYSATDPAIDINKILKKAVEESGADLVVMASHPPSVTDYIWPSHGGWVAEHSSASVFVVR
jgi:nucleotide-binding universal stress UspA family protein